MPFREYIDKLISETKIRQTNKPISKKLEISGVLKKLEPEPILFNHLSDSKFRVAGNIFCTKSSFADYFRIDSQEFIPRMINAINHPSRPQEIANAPCQQIIDFKPDLNTLPILFHCEKDGGNYITSGVVVTKHPHYGQNLDFHRFMQFSPTEMAIRIVRSRHFDNFLRDLNCLDVAVCIGNSPNILAAAATSIEMGKDELWIANSLEPLNVVHAKTVDLMVPADCEFVIEGTIFIDRKHSEGPFVDLTETYDVVRQEPVFEIKAITHRENAIWQALLPGGLEHKLLMGSPREPTIFKKVSEVVKCIDVSVNPGGCSWLHAIVKIDKMSEEDGKNAIEAAFAGHSSCKHVFIVDKDIDIYNPLEVEWAMATRFQGDKKMVIKTGEKGSSLDPSSEPETHLTTKIGFDLTKPLVAGGKSYDKATFPDVDLKFFLD